MPDVAGGHGFLTALLPLNTEPCRRPDDTITSPAHAVRELLSALPTAQHSPACARSGLQSPFARSLTTHFIRFAVIDDPAFNGRDPHDALLTAIHLAPDPLQGQTVDALERPYLLFCADFDVGHDAAEEASRVYLRNLCSLTPEVWSAILPHCKDFTGRDAPAAAAYILACRVETTMPFNDYPVAATRRGAPGWLASVAALVSGVFGRGRRSATGAPDVDLRTVLKALRLQSDFARFALDHQGDAAAALQSAFKDFLAASRPLDLDGPTQSPGVVP